MIDYTKLLKKISPKIDGESTTRLRTAVVNTVNSDGTVDILMPGGTSIPSVPRLAESAVQVGAVVQVIVFRGSLLVIGQSMGSGRSSGAGVWTRVQSNSPSGSVGTTLTNVLTTPSSTFLRNRVYEVKSHGGADVSVAGARAEFAVLRSGPVVVGEGYRFPCTVASTVFNTTFSGIYFGVNSSNNVTGTLELQMAVSSGTGRHYANSDQERNLEVWDVGELDQFSGVQVW
jgi:hypothetical protein